MMIYHKHQVVSLSYKKEGNNNDSNSNIADLQDGVNENINFITAIQAQLKALEKDVEQTESAVNDKVNPLTM